MVLHVFLEEQGQNHRYVFNPLNCLTHSVSIFRPLCRHRTAQDRVGVGEQLHPQDVPLPVCQSQQLNFLHRLLLGEVRPSDERARRCTADTVGFSLTRNEIYSKWGKKTLKNNTMEYNFTQNLNINN